MGMFSRVITAGILICSIQIAAIEAQGILFKPRLTKGGGLLQPPYVFSPVALNR